MSPEVKAPILHRGWPYLIAALALLPFMITGDSLWMDEGTTAMYAMQPDFQGWLSFLHHDNGGDCQMPLGMFFAWLGGKMLGFGEWQLRAVNLFWGVLTLLFMARIGRLLQLPWLPLLFALQPFFWFYTNEARPYAPQITFGAMVLLSLVQFLHDRGKGFAWAVIFTMGSVLLCFASMLAPAVIVATAGVGGMVAIRNGWKIERRSLLIILPGALVLLPLGYYYFETLARGAKGTQFWNVDLRYLVYIGYEISGSLGLGPSVENLREVALKGVWLSPAQFTVQWGLAFSLLAIVSVVLINAVWNRRIDGNNYLLPILIPFLAEVTILFLVGLLIHKAFWPRHYSAAFPFYVTALALALKSLLASRQRFAQMMSLALLGLLIAAVIGIRFGPEHRKENYRWASGRALEFVQQGKDVWWCAGRMTASYYGVTFDVHQPGQGEIFLMNHENWDGKFPLTISGIDSFAPDEIFLSRPDVHDGNRLVRKLISADGYHLEETRRSFELWSR
jgi:hypothetical protein